MRRLRHASCAIWTLGGALYGATARVRGVPTWGGGAMRIAQVGPWVEFPALFAEGFIIQGLRCVEDFEGPVHTRLSLRSAISHLFWPSRPLSRVQAARLLPWLHSHQSSSFPSSSTGIVAAQIGMKIVLVPVPGSISWAPRWALDWKKEWVQGIWGRLGFFGWARCEYDLPVGACHLTADGVIIPLYCGTGNPVCAVWWYWWKQDGALPSLVQGGPVVYRIWYRV